MSNTTTAQSGGISFIGLLTILFIGLKLTGHITWSWFWVLSPIIFTFMIAFIAIFVVFVAFIYDQSNKL